jgi:hypothetical protein
MSHHRGELLVRKASVSTADLAYARRVAGRTMRECRRPVVNPRLRVTPYALAGEAPIVVAQINAEVAGWPVRSQVAASTPRDAADRAADGLSHHLDRLCRHLTAVEAGAKTFTSDEWDSAPPPAPAGLAGTRVRARSVVRRKWCSLARQSIDLAAFTMDLCDYRFHLFAGETGQALLVYRGGASGYRLVGTSVPSDAVRATVPMTTSPQPPGLVTPTEAAAVLACDAAMQFVFFLDPVHGRGAVLYRRYDGHLGLMEQAPR